LVWVVPKTFFGYYGFYLFEAVGFFGDVKDDLAGLRGGLGVPQFVVLTENPWISLLYSRESFYNYSEA
jgi:hypothetical protein